MNELEAAWKVCVRWREPELEPISDAEDEG
jgi:hypothetical protein